MEEKENYANVNFFKHLKYTFYSFIHSFIHSISIKEYILKQNFQINLFH